MNLPDCSFYLLGMGDRQKLLYREGRLLDLASRTLLREWDVARESIEPAEYTVRLGLRDGRSVVLQEDEEGVWVEEDGRRTCLTASEIRLPRFQGHPHAALLRALHQEVLINIVDGRPVPNLLVYPKPWYRDAAVMCMVVERTDNLRLVRDWVMGLREPFDRNNGGNREPDNLGQALYMISLVSDRSHPLVDTILATVPEFRRGNHIVGSTDFAEHPVYQTRWLEFGLQCLGLDGPYVVPDVPDSYACLFWWGDRTAELEAPHFQDQLGGPYPYLGWAEAHSRGEVPAGAWTAERYPLTWEAEASQADYARMAVVSPEYVERCLCAPHSWHAAEMMLCLLAQGIGHAAAGR